MIALRRSTAADLPYVTALERHVDNRELIGQWTDEQHRDAIDEREGWSHWILERDGAPAGYLIARDCRAHGAGLYIKRILVGDKGRGTGQAGLAAFIRDARERHGEPLIWLIVRSGNVRAESVYGKLGFVRFEPAPDEARRFDAVAEAPPERCFRMRLAPER